MPASSEKDGLLLMLSFLRHGTPRIEIDEDANRLSRNLPRSRVVKILFAEAAAEAFAELPLSTKRKAAGSLELLEQHPRMYPVRRRGLMRGYYLALCRLSRHLVYYSVNAQEVRISAIIPGAMRRA